MKGVFDSDVAIDLLQGLPQAAVEMSRCTERCISIITWMEVMAGARNASEEEKIRHYLGTFHLLPVSEAIAERTVQLRRQRRLKLPDAIIWATALEIGCVLVTRNTKDFPPEDSSIRIPYRL